MDVKQEQTTQQGSPEAALPTSDFAKSWGNWAHENREQFTNSTGHILYRNIAKVLAGVVPTALSFTATRYAFKAYNEAKHLTSGIHKPLKAITKIPLAQQTVFIFTGFTAFRAFCKVWQRNYDRIFNHSDTPDASIQAVDNLPTNILKDLRDIMPAEAGATAIAAFPLAAIKTGFKHPEGPLTGNFLQAKKGFPNDWIASIPAYTVFFESNDRMYDDFTHGKDSADYYNNLRSTPETPGGDAKHKQYGFFMDDGLGRIAFRRTGSLLLGVAPFIGFMRYSKAAIGEVTPGKGSFLKNTAKEYIHYAGFAACTALMEIYTKAYDELFRKLEAKDNAASRER